MVSDAIYWAAEEAPVLEIEASFQSGTGELGLKSELVIQPFGLAERTDFPAWEPQDATRKKENESKRKDFPPAPAIVIPFSVQGDGKMHTYALKLSENPNYRGAMRQLRLNFPATDGSADVRRISLHRCPDVDLYRDAPPQSRLGVLEKPKLLSSGI